MCGIAGVFHRTNPESVDHDVLRRMRDLLAYRGPDAAGEFFDGPVGLGVRRLAIIDLAGGSQPVSSPDGRYTIVFNGEIYNYRELRRGLEDSYPFRTNSDTEVLLAQLITAGPAGLTDLNGMFAFALWDKEKEELFLARDRFGKKPLYYADLDGRFLFGSEPKSLLAHPSLPRALDQEALTQYFLYEYVPSPRTPYLHMKKLPPGHWLKVGRTSMDVRRWWQIPASSSHQALPTGDLVSQFDDRLRSAVTARMVADVPVGILLSGGLDSTAIGWYMRQRTPDLHSFSVSFNERTFDESRFARLAASSLGTTHHAIPFTLDRFHESLALLQQRMDEPLADASFLPTIAVALEARKWVTVVLDGDGADELLLGYNTFPAYELSLLAERIPTLLRRAIETSVQALPTRYTDFSLDFKLKSFLRGLPFQGALRNQVWIGSFHDVELQELLRPAWHAALHELYRPVLETERQLQELHPLEQLSVVYLAHYLPEDILVKIDRATMYASVEARTPYLDPHLTSFILSLPLHERYRAFRGKRLLERTMAGRIPEQILRRPKKGFGIPLGQWLRGPLQPLLRETLAPEKLAATGVLEPTEVRRLVKEHLAGKADHRKKLWTLMTFQWWIERWGK